MIGESLPAALSGVRLPLVVETGVEGGFVRRVPQAKVVVPFLLFYSMTIKATKVRLSAMTIPT